MHTILDDRQRYQRKVTGPLGTGGGGGGGGGRGRGLNYEIVEIKADHNSKDVFLDLRLTYGQPHETYINPRQFGAPDENHVMQYLSVAVLNLLLYSSFIISGDVT